MAIELLDPNKIHEIVYSEDKGGNPTVFKARALRASEAATLADLSRVNLDGSIAMNRRQKAVLAFRMAVTGWDNLDLVPAWEDTQFGRLLSDSIMDRIPLDVVLEVGAKIQEANELSGDDEKN